MMTELDWIILTLVGICGFYLSTKHLGKHGLDMFKNFAAFFADDEIGDDD